MKRGRLPILIALSVATILSVTIALLLRNTPAVELLELKLYDRATAKRALPMDPDSPVVKVVFSEKFIDGGEKIAGEYWQHPIHDDKLALLIGRLLEAGAVAVGVDIWRGVSQPVGNEDVTLDELLAERWEVQWIHDPDSERKLYRPPAGLAEDPSRAVLAAVPSDSGLSNRYRRGIFLESAGDGVALSLAMSVANLYLWSREVPVQWSEDEGGEHQFGAASLRGFRGSDGAYREQDAGGIQTLLTFPHREYPERDFGWAMEADLAELEAFVGGKGVFVGITSTAVKDELATPISEAQRGIDIHAAFADQIIGGALGQWPIAVRTFSNTWEVFGVVAMALLGIGIGALVRNGLISGALVVGVSLSTLAAGGALLAKLYWFPVVSPTIAVLTGFVLASAAFRAVEWHLLSQVRGVMQTLLGDDQVNLVWSEREQLLGSGKIDSKPSYATLMMTDLKGYTTATEKLGRDGVLPWLNRYMGRMSQIVGDHGGFVKEYVGDAIYAVFGLGKTEDEAAAASRQAVLCALAMREALGALNIDYERDDLPTAGMRVGINSGEVSVGSMGSYGAMEYAIMGDAVNTAARLESYDKELEEAAVCRVLVSDSTLELAGDGFESKRVGELDLKGKSKKVGAHLIFSAS